MSAVVGKIEFNAAVVAAIRPLCQRIIGKHRHSFGGGRAAIIFEPRIQTVFYGREIIPKDARAAAVGHFCIQFGMNV